MPRQIPNLQTPTIDKSPDQQFAPDIEYLANYVQSQINEIDIPKTMQPQRLLTIDSNSPITESFVRHASLHRILGRYGLYDAYIDPINSPMAEYTETHEDWRVDLHVPGSSGFFRVDYQELALYKPQIARQSFFYGHR
jgi:hypothetical protein